MGGSARISSRVRRRWYRASTSGRRAGSMACSSTRCLTFTNAKVRTARISQRCPPFSKNFVHTSKLSFPTSCWTLKQARRKFMPPRFAAHGKAGLVEPQLATKAMNYLSSFFGCIQHIWVDFAGCAGMRPCPNLTNLLVKVVLAQASHDYMQTFGLQLCRLGKLLVVHTRNQ